jgi:type I restriction enzyme R subunit
LPHWDVPGATYFVTTCLEGSIPAQGHLELAHYRSELDKRPRPPDRDEKHWAVDQWKLAFARTEQWLDVDPSIRWLSEPRLAQIVVDAVRHFDGQRYDILAYVVMPSHFHWVFRPLSVDGLAARQQITHSINRFTAQECNRVLGRAGQFWQHESYDHWVRDEDELERIVAYVEGNPVKAGLVTEAADWPFSSAAKRDRV